MGADTIVIHSGSAGKITREEAQELIDCIWVKLNDLNKVRDADSAEGFAGYSLFQNLIVGGQDKYGLDATNDLSFMCVTATEHVFLPQPSFSVRVWNGTPHEFLIRAAELTRTGIGLPAYYNDEVIIPALQNRGLTLEDARDYNIIGCVEPQKAAGALVWAVGEMERRFNMIETHSVRDIKGYNRIMKEHPELGKPLPQIVIVIDELNDLMMSARDAVEDAICRIAQKARAAGIHLLIGTQRPSVDVITGVIKANIPSRIAFHVSSQVDSRTILDMSGAEKLLNNGDMLFYPVGVPKPIRVQGAFVEDEEVEAVTSFLKRGVDASAIYDDEVMANIEREAEKCMPKDKRGERGESDGDSGDRDDLFSDPQFISAVEIAISQGQISTSKLQSKMRIGFQKATFFVDNMEEMGIVGPLNGAKPREVLISMAQFLEMKARH
jgi:hypothetical protein